MVGNQMNKKEIITTNNNPEYNRLLLSVGTTLEQGRQQAVYAVNSAMVQTYWEIGRQIVEYEQHGNEKAEYGSDVLNRLSRDLTNRYAPSIYTTRIMKKVAGLTEDVLRERIESHLIDYNALVTNDFDTYFVDRAKKLLDLIENATGKKIADRNAENTVEQFGSRLV